MPFDIVLDKVNMDLLTNEGFCNALFYACNLAPGAGHMTGPVCSTWIFLRLGVLLEYD